MACQMVKFMALSDTHNFEREEAEELCPLAQSSQKVDVVLHCGDLTQIGGISAYKKALRMFGDFDAELKLVIAGNHDISLDKEYWNTHLEEDDEPEEHEEAVGIMTGPLAKTAGVTYLTEGLHVFTLKSGASFKIFVSPYQPECGDWAFGYKRDEPRWNIPEDADIVMTHGPPYDILDFTGDGKRAGCKSLLAAVQKVKPLMHCFGHIHEGYGTQVEDWPEADRLRGGADTASQNLTKVTVGKAGCEGKVCEMGIVRGESTLMVNAAIMNERNKPVNAPWIVELAL